MSYSNYLRAMAEAKRCDYYHASGGKTEKAIQRAERMLGVRFSRQYRNFNKNYGSLVFSGYEIFGVDPDDFDEMERNVVAYTLNEREEYHLPRNLIPISNFYNGYMAYLDYSNLNVENEPAVVKAEYNGTSYTIVSVIAEDFGDFVLYLLRESRAS